MHEGGGLVIRMTDLPALRSHNVTLLRGLLQRPTMYTPGGWAVEAFILHVLSEIAFIDSTTSALEGELERLRATGLWHPPNHAYGVTESFLATLPDCRVGLEVEVSAVYAQVAHRLGHLPAAVSVPPPGAWSVLSGAWTSAPLTPESALGTLGPPTVQLGSTTHDLALCYGTLDGDWAALHFKVAPVSSGADVGQQRSHSNEPGTPGLVLRWLRLSSCTLDRSIVVTPAGSELSRRGLAHPVFQLDRWLAGDRDPFIRRPPDLGEG